MKKINLFKGDKTKTNYSLLVYLVLIMFAFILYYFTKQVLFSFITIFVGAGMFHLYSSTIIEKSKSKQVKSEGKIYIDFYKNFELYSSIENDYQAGFNKAIDLLPVCKLKERLTEYQENTLTLEEALVLLSSRSEFQLITEIKRSLLVSEDFYEKNQRISQLIDRYKNTLMPYKKSVDYASLGILMFACYIVITALLVYVSKK